MPPDVVYFLLVLTKQESPWFNETTIVEEVVGLVSTETEELNNWIDPNMSLLRTNSTGIWEDGDPDMVTVRT